MAVVAFPSNTAITYPQVERLKGDSRMTNGQRIAVDLGNGVGVVVAVRDVGNGRFVADHIATGQQLTVDPTNPSVPQWRSDSGGEWQQFSVDGNVICFSTGNNKGIARLFGFVTLP